MSAIHEQAMNYVYQQVQQRLVGYFTRAERTALQLLIQRIVVAAGGMEQVGECWWPMAVVKSAATPWRYCVPHN